MIVPEKSEFEKLAKEFAELLSDEYYHTPDFLQSLEGKGEKIHSWDLISVYIAIRHTGHFLTFANCLNSPALENYPQLLEAMEELSPDIERMKFLERTSQQFVNQTQLMELEKPSAGEQMLLEREKDFYFRDDIVANETSKELQQARIVYQRLLSESEQEFLSRDDASALARRAIETRNEQGSIHPAAALGLSFLERFQVNIDGLIVGPQFEKLFARQNTSDLKNGANHVDDLSFKNIHTLFYLVLYDRYRLGLNEFQGNFCEAYLEGISLERELPLKELAEPLRKDAEAMIFSQWKTWKEFATGCDCSEEFMSALYRVEAFAQENQAPQRIAEEGAHEQKPQKDSDKKRGI